MKVSTIADVSIEDLLLTALLGCVPVSWRRRTAGKTLHRAIGHGGAFFEVGREEIRLLPGDLLAVLTGGPSLEFPYRIAQLRAGGDSSQAHDGANGN